MNKNHILFFVIAGLICWSPLLTENASGQPPTSTEQESPFSIDNPVEVGDEGDLAAQIAGRAAARTQENDRQMIMINSRYAGWEEAARDGDKRVGETLRGNWIMVDSNGRFSGTIVPTQGADVARMNVFLMNKGRLVKQTSVDDRGGFEFNNVRQGAYSIIGWGDKGFFAFGVNILAHNPDSEGVSNQMKVTAFQNRTSINTDWIRHFSARVTYRVFGRYPTDEAKDSEPALYGFFGLTNFTPESVAATSISSHPVSKTADGRLIGRIHQLNSISGRPVDVRTTKVMLFQDDDVVASTTTDNFGVFEFLEVPDGSYAVTAVGVDGVGQIGINVGSSATMNDVGEFVGEEHPIDFTLVSSETMGWLNHYAGEVAYRRALLAPRPQVANASAPAPFMGVGGGVCPNCQNQAGGCTKCQDQYLMSLCRSRGLTFEQWQMYCQGRKLPGPLNLRNIGSGEFLSDAARRIRENSRKVDSAFERAFYPDNDTEQLQELQRIYNSQQQLQQVPQGFAPQVVIPQASPSQLVPQLNIPQQTPSILQPSFGSGTRGGFGGSGSGTRGGFGGGSGTR